MQAGFEDAMRLPFRFREMAAHRKNLTSKPPFTASGSGRRLLPSNDYRVSRKRGAIGRARWIALAAMAAWPKATAIWLRSVTTSPMA